MVGSIAAGGGGFGGVAAYCLEEKLQQQEQQEQQKQEDERQEREQEAREWMPDQAGAAEEALAREETEILSARGRQQEQDSPAWSRSAARRDEEEKKKRAGERERERKAEGARRLAARVEWTETRNLATNDPWRAARIMGATAADGPALKRLSGVKATGRKLAKPVCHYTLNWAREERPDRQEMSRAVTGSLQALGLDKHQVLIVAHGDRPHAHAHVIVNRVDAENGKAASLSQSRLKLSRWAESYERTQGKIRCPNRERHNRMRARGERVEPQRRIPQSRFQRERQIPPAHRRVPPERARLNAEEQGQWKRIERSVREQSARSRARSIADLSTRANGAWRGLYDRQRQEQKAEAKADSTLRGRFQRWAGERFPSGPVACHLDPQLGALAGLALRNGDAAPAGAGRAGETAYGESAGDRAHHSAELQLPSGARGYRGGGIEPGAPGSRAAPRGAGAGRAVAEGARSAAAETTGPAERTGTQPGPR